MQFAPNLLNPLGKCPRRSLINPNTAVHAHGLQHIDIGSTLPQHPLTRAAQAGAQVPAFTCPIKTRLTFTYVSSGFPF
jgi:hypothetical protein